MKLIHRESHIDKECVDVVIVLPGKEGVRVWVCRRMRNVIRDVSSLVCAPPQHERKAWHPPHLNHVPIIGCID